MKLYLVGATRLSDGMGQFLADRKLTWIRSDEASDAENIVEAAGRICYMSFGKRQHRIGNDAYIGNLIAQQHDSVLEHATFTILADEITRALSHQIVRHRIGFSYSQLSQQYYDESDTEIDAPEFIKGDEKLVEQWNDLMEQTQSMYRSLLAYGESEGERAGISPREIKRLSKSAARSVLPNATPTSIMVTGNARSWRHFLRIRGDIGGDPEMRQYCTELFRLLSKASPTLFADFGIKSDDLGEFVSASLEAQ